MAWDLKVPVKAKNKNQLPYLFSIQFSLTNRPRGATIAIENATSQKAMTKSVLPVCRFSERRTQAASALNGGANRTALEPSPKGCTVVPR